MKKFLKGILITLGSIVLLVGLLIGGLNVIKFGIYHEYYSIRTNICTNPGLNDDAIPQGIAVSQDEDLILTSCYMKTNKPSRIYLTNTKNESRYVSLYQDDKEFKGHVGGIGISNNLVFLANGGYVSIFDLNYLKNAISRIDLTIKVKVNGEDGVASCVFANSKYLFVAEFHDGKNYITNHPIETNDGTYHAICSQYKLTDLSTPYRVYSIRNKVQGFCFTDDGRIVLSTSYGLADSIYYVYNQDKIVDSKETYLGAPLYKLDSYSKKVKGPAMSEDLDYKDGKVYTLTESASNKYIFGKLFNATKIVGLAL